MCNDTGTLMILDEIQTGIGRSGRMFAFQHADLLPDVMTLAKALALVEAGAWTGPSAAADFAACVAEGYRAAVEALHRALNS